MANYTTAAQRYNNRMDKIFSKAQEHAEKEGKTSAWDKKDMRSDAMKHKSSISKVLSKKINKDGFDSNKSWGNSSQKGHGVNSPAMMEARKRFAKK